MLAESNADSPRAIGSAFTYSSRPKPALEKGKCGLSSTVWSGNDHNLGYCFTHEIPKLTALIVTTSVDLIERCLQFVAFRFESFVVGVGRNVDWRSDVHARARKG